jgi:hypothetical protein
VDTEILANTVRTLHFLPGAKMKDIYSKYAKEQCTCVDLNPPATVLLC